MNQPVTMVAIRQLVGDWGNAPAGSLFEIENEEMALALEARGLAYRYRLPVVRDVRAEGIDKVKAAIKMRPEHPNKMLAVTENK